MSLRLVGELEIDDGEQCVRRLGSVSLHRRGILYRHHRHLAHRLSWSEITRWTTGRDSSPDAPRHTHALVITWPRGQLVLRVRGPYGALALTRVRDRIRDHMHELLV
jgi:hypothetical protein